MASCGDLGAAVDILSMVWSKSNLFTLDSCASLLPLLKELLASPHDEYVITAMQVLQILLQNFGPIITQTRSLNPSGGPVDIQVGGMLARWASKERWGMCREACTALWDMQPLQA